MNKSLINKYCRKFGFEIHGTGYMQSLEKNAFKENAFIKQQEICGNAQVIFDIGANVGDITIHYKKLFPSAHVYALEPFPSSFQILKNRIAGIEGITLYQKAIGNEAGEKVFYVNHNADTNSLLRPKKMGLNSDKQVANKSEIKVTVCTIDEFCKTEGIRSIDILKLDIQGGELAALQGGSHLLAEKKIGLIYTEAYFRQQYIDQPLFHDISKYLEQFGYFIQDIYNPIYGRGSVAWCDAVFLPS